MRCLFIVLFVIGICPKCKCQKARTYNWNWKTDGAVLAGSIAGHFGSQVIINNAEKATFSDLKLLDKSSVWGFDRGALDNNSVRAAEISDIFLYSSFAVPLIAQFDKGASGDKGAILGMMFETFLINHAITSTFKGATNRFRPYTYGTLLNEQGYIPSSARQSFISGHTSNVAAASFFTAKVLSDLHPDSQWKPVIWASAILIPATTGYLRYRAGKHFPSDVIAGYGVGALVGFMIPHFHKIKLPNEDMNLTLGSVGGAGMGMSFTVQLN